MDCHQIGILNSCELHIHYTEPFTIICWMLLAIVIWQLKSFIWLLIKWSFVLVISLFSVLIGFAFVQNVFAG